MIVLPLTPQDLTILDRALGERPYREVAAIIANINHQLQRMEEKKGNDGKKAGG